MTIPFLDLRVTDPAIRAALVAAFERVLDHGRLVNGIELDAFETRFAGQLGRAHAVGVGSGSSAVYLACRAVGLRQGDEVVTTPLSWMATYHAIAGTGATPMAVDIRDDLNIDPDQIEAAITARTRAILVVHFTGRMCDMDPIMEIATRRNLVLIEDAAQAYGATYRGRSAGTFGAVAAFSMNAMKMLSAFGEAGAVVTDDPAIADALRALRYCGVAIARDKERCEAIELNHRLDALQAALLGVQLDHVTARIARRRRIAAYYDEALGGLVEVPRDAPDWRHGYYTYTIQTEQRDRLRHDLIASGIECQIQHPILMCDQPPYQSLPGRDLPIARRMVGRILSIPVHEKLTDVQVERVAARIRKSLGA